MQQDERPLCSSVHLTCCPEAQVHHQHRGVHQVDVIQAVRVVQFVHQPADQIVLYHGSLLVPSTKSGTFESLSAEQVTSLESRLANKMLCKNVGICRKLF